MDLNKAIARIEENRVRAEASFVFCLWKDPQRYDDYKNVNEGTDKTLICEDQVFYFMIGRGIRRQGFTNIDNITLDTYLADKPSLRKHYEELNGWRACVGMMELVDPENTDSYYNQISKMNTLKILATKYDELLSHPERFDDATNEDVYNTFELLNNQAALTTGNSAKVENIIADEKYLDQCDAGMGVGVQYDKVAKLLNSLTLGLPIGDMYLLAAHSGSFKSSFLFNNMVVPIAENGYKVCIISNEMTVDAYKNLLLVHVLTNDLNYWNITRKKLKTGHFTEEDKKMLREAIKIEKEKYSDIQFVKLFESDTSSLVKYIKRLARSGTKVFIYDTLKASDSSGNDDRMWQTLLMDSRRIFQAVSKEQVCFVASFQLALYTTNQRYLDASCLSSSKQIKEVCSEVCLQRLLWDDEYPNEKYDCEPYRYKKTESGKYIKVPVEIDKDKKYVVIFLDKTRNDERGQCLLYCVNGAYNTWQEIGYCTIKNDHGQYDRR